MKSLKVHKICFNPNWEVWGWTPASLWPQGLSRPRLVPELCSAQAVLRQQQWNWLTGCLGIKKRPSEALSCPCLSQFTRIKLQLPKHSLARTWIWFHEAPSPLPPHWGPPATLVMIPPAPSYPRSASAHDGFTLVLRSQCLKDNGRRGGHESKFFCR